MEKKRRMTKALREEFSNKYFAIEDVQGIGTEYYPNPLKKSGKIAFKVYIKNLDKNKNNFPAEYAGHKVVLEETEGFFAFNQAFAEEVGHNI